MPYKRYYRKRRPKTSRGRSTTGRRNYRSRYGRKALSKRFPRLSKSYPITAGKSPFPSSLLTKHVYSDTGFFLTPAVGNNYNPYHNFSHNSPFDPDVTGVGVQPYYFDQLSALYNRYHCFASKIKIWFYTEETKTTMNHMVLSLFPRQTTAPVSYREPGDLQQLYRCKQLATDPDRLTNKSHSMTNYCHVKEWYPTSSKDKDLGSAPTSNPTTRTYWVLYANTADLSEEATIFFDVKITYYVRWSLPVNIDES